MTAPGSHRGGAYSWYVVSLLSLAHLVSFLDRFVLSVVLTPLRIDFPLGDTQLGLLHGTGFVVLYGVAALPLGRLADVTHRRNLIIFGLLSWSLCTIGFGFAHSVTGLFAARIGVGLGEACLVPAGMSLVVAYVERDRLGRGVALFTLGASLGAGTALLMGGTLLAWLQARHGLAIRGITLSPWRALFALSGLPGVALAVAMLLTVREPARRAAATQRPRLRDVLSFFVARRFALLGHICAGALLILAGQSVLAWAPTFYVRAFHLPPTEAAQSVGLVALLVTPLGVLGGGALYDWIRERGIPFGSARIIALTAVGTAVPAAIFLIAGAALTSLVALGMTILLLSVATPCLLTALQLMAPERFRGASTALFLMMTTLIGVGLGPFLTGLFSERIFTAPDGIRLALLTVIFAALGASAASAWLSRQAVDAAIAEGQDALHFG